MPMHREIEVCDAFDDNPKRRIPAKSFTLSLFTTVPVQQLLTRNF